MADRLTNREYFHEALSFECSLLAGLPKEVMIQRVLNCPFLSRVLEEYIKDIERQGIRGPSCMTPEVLNKWFDEGVSTIRPDGSHDVRVAEGEEISQSIISQQ